MTFNSSRLPGIGDTLDDQFRDWLASDESGATISRFVQLAREQANRGRKVSAKAIIEYLRVWGDPPLKNFDNSLTSRLARYVMAGDYGLKDYFQTRTLVAR